MGDFLVCCHHKARLNVHSRSSKSHLPHFEDHDSMAVLSEATNISYISWCLQKSKNFKLCHNSRFRTSLCNKILVGFIHRKTLWQHKTKSKVSCLKLEKWIYFKMVLTEYDLQVSIKLEALSHRCRISLSVDFCSCFKRFFPPLTSPERIFFEFPATTKFWRRQGNQAPSGNLQKNMSGIMTLMKK